MENEPPSREPLNQISTSASRCVLQTEHGCDVDSNDGVNRRSNLEKMVQTILLHDYGDNQTQKSSGKNYSFGEAARIALERVRVSQESTKRNNPKRTNSIANQIENVSNGQDISLALHAVADCKSFRQAEFRRLARSAAGAIDEYSRQLERIWQTLVIIEELPRTSGKGNAETLEMMRILAHKALDLRS